MIPWALIAEVGLRIINFLFAKGEKRDEARRKFLEFVKKQDQVVLRTALLRRETQIAKSRLLAEREALLKAIESDTLK